MALVDVNQIARALNLTTARVHQLKAEGLPMVARGQYDFAPCVLWYIRYLQNAIKSRSSGEDGNITTLMSERTKQARANAERTQMANMKARGELVPAATVRQQVLMAVAYLGQDLTAIPQRITTDETLQAKFEDELTRARNNFAEHLGSLADASPGLAGRPRKLQGTRTPNARRVGRRRASAAAGDARAGAVEK